MEKSCFYVIIHFSAMCLYKIVSSSALSEYRMQSLPFIDFYHQPLNTVVIKGQTLCLHCQIGTFSTENVKLNSVLPSNVIWFKDNRRLLFNSKLRERRALLQNGSLIISKAVHDSAVEADSGSYKCQVEYQKNVLLSRTAVVKVIDINRNQHHTSFVKCPGGIVRFNCAVVFDDPSLVIRWYKGDVLVGHNRDWSYKAKQDFFTANVEQATQSFVSEYRNSIVLPNGAFEISNLTKANAGIYSCEVESDGEGMLGNRYTLDVSGECSWDVKPYFIVQPTPRTVISGERTLFECAVSIPHSTSSVIWFQNTTKIQFRPNGRFKLLGQGNLFVEKVTKMDEAEYSCVIDDHNSPLLASATLNVIEPPRFVEVGNHTRVAHVGCLVKYHCHVSGSPLPFITWYKDGQMLIDMQLSNIRDKSISVHIRSLDDEGIYQCFAENDAGQIHATYQLKLLDRDATSNWASPPSAARDVLLLEDLTASTAVLSWPISFGFSQSTKYKVLMFDVDDNRHQVLKSTETRVILTGLTPGHGIRVSVVPSTDLCDGPPSQELTFTVPKMDLVVGMVENFAAEAASSSSILLTWMPPRLETSLSDLRYKIIMQEIDTNYIQETVVEETAHEFYGLKKFTTYGFKIAAIDQNGIVGPFSSQIVTKTSEDAPELPPDNISVDTDSSVSAVVRWDPPPKTSVNGELLGYRIKYKVIDGRKSYFVPIDPSDTRFILKGLRRNTKYSVRLQTVNRVGRSPFSMKIIFRTAKKELLEPRAPDKPALLDTQRKSTEITVLWHPPAGDIHVREYIIGWGENGPYEHTASVDSDRRYYRITGLRPLTQYFISVRAGNKAGLGMEYHTVARTVADTVEELYPPLGLHITVLTHSTLNISWHDSDRDKGARYYVVRYKTNVPEEPRVRTVNSSDVTCLIHGLRPHTVYEVSVRVVQGHRKSPWSMSASAVTKESEPGSAPTDLTVISMDGDLSTVQLNWQPPEQPNGEINGYLVFYTTDKTQDTRKWILEEASGDGLSTTIGGLTADTQYYFKVLASNTYGSGPYSLVAEFRTPKSGQTEEVTSASRDMPTWMWYVIIGAVGLLVVVIILVATIMMYRSRRAEKLSVKRRKQRNGLAHSAGSRLRSMSRNSWQHATPSAHSAASVGLLHPDRRSLRIGDSRYVGDYPNYRLPSEMTPLNVTSYVRAYPAPHSKTSDYLLRSPSAVCDIIPSEDIYDGGMRPLATVKQSTCDHYNTEYYPHSNVSSACHDYAGDSAYGSDHQHHQVLEDRPTARHEKPRNHHRDITPPSDQSPPYTNSLDSTRSLSFGSDEVTSQLASVEECVRDLKATHA